MNEYIVAVPPPPPNHQRVGSGHRIWSRAVENTRFQRRYQGWRGVPLVPIYVNHMRLFYVFEHEAELCEHTGTGHGQLWFSCVFACAYMRVYVCESLSKIYVDVYVCVWVLHQNTGGRGGMCGVSMCACMRVWMLICAYSNIYKYCKYIHACTCVFPTVCANIIHTLSWTCSNKAVHTHVLTHKYTPAYTYTRTTAHAPTVPVPPSCRGAFQQQGAGDTCLEFPRPPKCKERAATGQTTETQPWGRDSFNLDKLQDRQWKCYFQQVWMCAWWWWYDVKDCVCCR